MKLQEAKFSPGVCLWQCPSDRYRDTTEAQDFHHREAIQIIAMEPASSFSSPLPSLIFFLSSMFHPFLTFFFFYILFLPFSSWLALLSVSHPFLFHTCIQTWVPSNAGWLFLAQRAHRCTGIHFLQVLPLLLEWLICPPSQFWTKPRNTKSSPQTQWYSHRDIRDGQRQMTRPHR